MSKADFMNRLTRTIGRANLSIKKHSPEILVVAGVVGVVASAVMACKASTKVSAILEKRKEQIDGLHDIMANPEGELAVAYEKEYNEKFTEEQGKKELTVVYAQTALDFIKLYGPSVLLGVASIGCILASNNIIRKRNIALAAAYATIDTGFKEYRGRVIERFGKELDRELRYDVKAKEIEETVVDENGEEKTVTKVVSVVEPGQHKYSSYARCFDETCMGWERDAEYNLMFLRQVENQANDLLRAQGYLFLNDVYKMLGMKVSKAGQVVGWIYDEEHATGDNYVDFGLYDIHNEAKRLFINGYEKSVWLDFNVDGNILNDI